MAKLKQTVSLVPLKEDIRDKMTDKIINLAQTMGETKFYPYQEKFARRIVRSLLDNEGATITAIFSRQCIKADEFIFDKYGNVMPISEYSDSWYTKDDDLIQIKAFGGASVVCTKEHPIMTLDGWKPAGEIETNDMVVTLDSWDKFGNGVVQFEKDGEIHSISLSNDLLKFIGFSIFRRPQKRGFILINIKEKEIQDFIRPIIQHYFKDIHFRHSPQKFRYRIEGSLYEFIRKIVGIEKGYPRFLNDLTREQVISFLEGALLARGRVNRAQSIISVVLYCHDMRILEFCRQHFNKLGMRGSIASSKTGFLLTFSGVENYDKFEELFTDLPPKMYTNYFRARKPKEVVYLEGEDGEILRAARVHAVKEAGHGAVWDASFPVKEWFISGGIKVSNSGKTNTVAMVVAACMVILPELYELFPKELEQFKKGFWVGIFAPIGEQAVTLFDRVYDMLTTEKSKELLIGELRMPIPNKGTRGNTITLQNGSLCRFHSASQRSKVESKTYDLITFDESQDIPTSKALVAVLPMGAATNATVVFTGTPGYVTGIFYDMIKQNEDHDVLAVEEDKLHFEADYTLAQKYNPYYRRYIQREIKKLGIDSEAFRMSYRLIWPITRGMMFTKEMLEEYVFDSTLNFEDTYKAAPCIAGLDLGKSMDSTVLTILKVDWNNPDSEGNVRKEILDIFILDGDDWEAQYPKLVEKIESYWVDTLVCDSTGVGDPVRERIEVLLPKVTVIPFIFSPKTKDIGYKYLQQEVKENRVKLPNNARSKSLVRHKLFVSQMTNLRKAYSGKFLVPKPIDEKKGHDDICDSLMLANYGTYYDAMPFVEVDNTSIFADPRENFDIFKRNYSRPRR